MKPLLNIMKKSLVNLPTPTNISYLWNFGSLLGICLMIQIITGLFLAMHYTPNVEMAFSSVIHVCRDVNNGWMMRVCHANGASFFFICLYLHIGRGLYYNSFILMNTWMSGVTIFLLTMAAAFMGYVLPWGQMSFWGATVITNLLSAIPYIGKYLVEWIWGGFSISNATLNRFFVFHFILPFIIAFMVILHLFFLHETGSNNPLGLNSNIDKISFNPYFTLKDTLGFLIFFFFFLFVNTQLPYYLGDPDNFLKANPMVTPLHIKPEWYFLFAYAILRSIPNKLGGVVALLMSIAILYFIPFYYKQKYQSNQFKPKSQISFWLLTTTFFLLTWIGARPVEEPFIITGQILTVIYFSLFFIMYS